MRGLRGRRPLPRGMVRALHGWYRRTGRTLPWRGSSDPYRILVSEIMLQQTQASRVLVHYPRFLRRFPTLVSLSRARRSDVVRAWQGMGYNNRAVRLHCLALDVVRERAGRLPRSPEDLEDLPGIGRYTARAVACFAFHKQVAVVDTNVRRVLERWIGRSVSGADLENLAHAFMPDGSAEEWNQALMDLGALLCRARSPRCSECPVSEWCRSAFRLQAIPRSGSNTEPSRDGIPDRIYRGRIINRLRDTPRRSYVSARTLGISVKTPFRTRDRLWLVRLLSRLERDGLIDLRQRGRTLEARLAD